MTEDHFPPANLRLPGDYDAYPEMCGACERHVVSDHDHARDCPYWRGTDEA